mmetsp:Transcript_21248/g.64712  ORF Transcript_21248/g.64712 Transcript_21248/m.64712 type:complete len:116 (-) Transcript_21248:1320-1667(-)
MPQVADALFSYELEDDAYAAQQLRALVNKYPSFTDARAALAATAFRVGDEARALDDLEIVFEEDLRYSDDDWVSRIRKWPPRIAKDLKALVGTGDGKDLLREGLAKAGKKSLWED